MKELRYFDMTGQGFGAVFCPEYDLEFAGTTISSMPDVFIEDTYCLLADQYDIHFIFDSNLPTIDFYAVPLVDIFATDSNGGSWGTLCSPTDISNSTAKICYINRYKEVYIVADNLRSFLFPIESIGVRSRNMRKTEEVILYKNKEEAEQAVNFIKPGFEQTSMSEI